MNDADEDIKELRWQQSPPFNFSHRTRKYSAKKMNKTSLDNKNKSKMYIPLTLYNNFVKIRC